MSAIKKHLKIHSEQGNTDDPVWRPGAAGRYTPKRSHLKKSERGIRKNVTSRSVNVIVARHSALTPIKRAFVSNETKLRAVDEFDVLVHASSFAEAKASFA